VLSGLPVFALMEAEMTKVMHYTLLLVCAFQFFFAIVFFFQLPLAENVWPFEGTTPLTYIFIASIFAAAAASTLWATASRNYGALVGISLDYLAILTPLSIFAFQVSARTNDQQVAGFGVACAIGVVFGLVLLFWSIRIPMELTIPLPLLVRWSFIVFIVALLIVSVRLLLQVPNAIPWRVTPELSVVIGWIFFGAAIYFFYTLLRPGWVNAAGQLSGFLAYDVVLILPFIERLPTVAPEHRIGLIIYTLVVTYSGLLSLYYLFIHRPTRIW
jgi:hypothetical protein